jgi:hypothetical protein
MLPQLALAFPELGTAQPQLVSIHCHFAPILYEIINGSFLQLLRKFEFRVPQFETDKLFRFIPQLMTTFFRF